MTGEWWYPAIHQSNKLVFYEHKDVLDKSEPGINRTNSLLVTISTAACGLNISEHIQDPWK